jgi:hypothetical protein
MMMPADPRGIAEDLLPVELRGRTSTDLASAWPRWVSRRGGGHSRGSNKRRRLHRQLHIARATFTTRQRVTERDVAT